MAATTRTVPAWFWVVAIVLLLWNLVGVYALVQQLRFGAEAMGPATEYDRAIYDSMPVWYNWVFAVAEVGGVGGGLALLAQRSFARPLFLVSLLAVIVQFGYLFAATDIIVHKGTWVTYFPAFIAAMCLFQLWFAGDAQHRGWLR